MKKSMKRGTVTRRGALRTLAAGAAAGLGGTLGAPMIWAQTIRDVTLMHVGPAYSIFPDIAAQASRLAPQVAALLPDHRVVPTECASQIGSGSLPTDTIPSAGLRISGAGGDAPDRLSAWLRDRPRPVIGHIRDGALILDLRCLDRDADLMEALRTL